MLDRLRQRIARQEGFTLIELLVVIVIIGILMAIAIPSYLGFKDRANQRAASADVREAVPSAEAFYSDNGTYSSLTRSSLVSIDSGLAAAVDVSGTPTSTQYCLTASVGGKSAYYVGPGGSIIENPSSPPTGC